MFLKSQSIESLLFSLIVLLAIGSLDTAFATDSRTTTTTLRTQTIFTNNSDCRGNEGDVCRGSIQQGGIDININGGTLNFHLCSEGINRDPSDVPCRVTPPMIPPGADTQVGTGLDPITINDNGATASFGGMTNDPIPSGSSNFVIPGFLVHGTSPGEVTLRCTSEPTCGKTTFQNIITHFQNFRSVPNGVARTPSGPLCTQVRCNHIEFTVDQQMQGQDAADTPFKIDFVIDSATDANGKLISGTATGSYTITCNTGGCSNGSGTFSVTEPGGGFSPSSTGFVTINSQTSGGCSAGTQVDPFHQNGVSCQSR
ncbi:MAG: hypothetical protein ACE5GK_08860 [Nitrospiria bacterium]